MLVSTSKRLSVILLEFSISVVLKTTCCSSKTAAISRIELNTTNIVVENWLNLLGIRKCGALKIIFMAYLVYTLIFKSLMIILSFVLSEAALAVNEITSILGRLFSSNLRNCIKLVYDTVSDSEIENCLVA